ncbi:hypothetical protein Sjap_015866 [Stephania japonica]|uniref:Cytochrome P450 n=1 Tax=Stephania japonica TaxID=461633 RepID=A0AAP0NSY1_9MAGN
MADLNNYSILISILLTISIFIWRSLQISRAAGRRTVRLPPSPLRLPIIGHFHLLSLKLHHSFYKLANTYGPLIHIYIGSVPCVIASSAEIAQEFLKTHDLSFSSRPILSAAVLYLAYGSADFIFSPYGPYWKFMKKLCMSKLLLSRRCSELENEATEIREMIEEITRLLGKLDLSDYIWFCKNLNLQGFRKIFEQVHVKYDLMIEKIIKEHEVDRKSMKDDMGSEDGSRHQMKNILHILLDISKDDGAEMRLTRENIKAFILDIFLAGTETAAITIEWALAELINNQPILEKAREEINKVVGKSRLVEESDIPNLHFLQAIVKETLRLHPIVPITLREAIENCTVGGYDIPAKTWLFVNIWAIGRDPKHWKNPLEFNPDRFFGSDLSNLDMRGQNFHFIPFGSGRRGCPGITLALQVVQTTVAAVIQCFDLKNDNGTNQVEVDMTEAAGALTLARANPLNCTPVPKLDLLPLLN